jgi:ribosomal protein L37E
MSRHCPKCGYGDSSRERSMDGKTTCNACGFSISNVEWDKLSEATQTSESNVSDAAVGETKKN